MTFRSSKVDVERAIDSFRDHKVIHCTRQDSMRLDFGRSDFAFFPKMERTILLILTGMLKRRPSVAFIT